MSVNDVHKQNYAVDQIQHGVSVFKDILLRKRILLKSVAIPTSGRGVADQERLLQAGGKSATDDAISGMSRSAGGSANHCRFLLLDRWMTETQFGPKPMNKKT